METIIITKQEAKINGHKRFFSGEPCKKGHVVERLVSSGECVACKRDREHRKYTTDPSSYEQYYLNNRERLLQLQKMRDDVRRDDKIEYGRMWRANNKEYAAQYRHRRADLYRYHAALRRAAKLRATPKWAEFDQIKHIYIQAETMSRETGIPYEVDHRVPLKHNLVCGLHCMANLQIITKEENGQKKNKFFIG